MYSSQVPQTQLALTNRDIEFISTSNITSRHLVAHINDITKLVEQVGNFSTSEFVIGSNFKYKDWLGSYR